MGTTVGNSTLCSMFMPLAVRRLRVLLKAPTRRKTLARRRISWPYKAPVFSHMCTPSSVALVGVISLFSFWFCCCRQNTAGVTATPRLKQPTLHLVTMIFRIWYHNLIYRVFASVHQVEIVVHQERSNPWNMLPRKILPSVLQVTIPYCNSVSKAEDRNTLSASSKYLKLSFFNRLQRFTWEKLFLKALPWSKQSHAPSRIGWNLKFTIQFRP